MNFKGKLSVFLVLIISTIFLVPNFALAVTVGQQLTSPESGWTRYDDSDTNLIYVGTWGHATYQNSTLYNKTETSTASKGDYLTFKFYGSKLRIITSFQSNLVSNGIIDVDGVQSTFNQYRSSQLTCVIAYEKLNLSLGEHIVTITMPNEAGKCLQIDAIDTDGKIIPSSTTTLTAAQSVTGSSITLNWSAVIDASGYKIMRSDISGGPYNTILNDNYLGTNYVDETATPNTMYYYVVIPLFDGLEGYKSNEASATIINSGKALLTVTYTNGITRSYDLQISQIDDFITKYTNYLAGSGLPYYKFEKSPLSSNFTKRTEYILFIHLSNFDVDEY